MPTKSSIMNLMVKKDDNPKVTIVIPVYNGENYVKYALDSAVNQTYKNLEILVVDDGSTDGTEEIVKKYKDKVTYIKKENGGVSTALNLAIEKMKGEYFSWLSHDDVYEPNKVEREVEFLKEHNYLGKKVIVFSDYNLIDKNGKLIGSVIKDHREMELKPEYGLLKGHINGLSLLIPKTAFDEYGGFDTKLSCAQDYEKWWSMMKTYKFIHIPEVLVNTRYHRKQTTNTSPKVLTEGNALYYKIISEIPEKRINEMEGSRYNFYREISEFHQDSVYTELSRKCREWADEILDKALKAEAPQKKVSVIIPFYNREKETIRAIKSVLNQTYKNFEIILVDDCSEEKIDAVKELVKKHDNIKLISNKKNSGPSVSRNNGIKAATGDYIAFLDSDDEFVSDKLETQLKYIAATNAKISHTSYIRELNGKQTVVSSGVQSGHCEKKLMYSCMIATPTVMIDRKWLMDRGCLFNTELHTGEDNCFWLELMKGDTYLTGVDKPLSIVHANDKSAAFSIDRQVEGLKSIIHYLINDEYYGQFDFELSRLMLGYANYATKKHERDLGVLVEGSALKKLLFFIKQEGLSSTMQRVMKKIKKTTSSKSEN
ncbi:glycosyltransferase [Candidatus Saccharibacteria bacterium]|nr:glycosyltransferase [Candidatus Saccharibacteria bacterium]